jgi:hypothetical protein
MIALLVAIVALLALLVLGVVALLFTVARMDARFGRDQERPPAP